MNRLEVRALLVAQERGLPRPSRGALQLQGISIEDCLDEEAFLKTLEESLQQHVATLSQQFLVLSASQVDRLAFRLHDALVPKRDVDTRVIQAWTIQPQLQLKVKASAHIQVLKLSTILREVQWLRVHQPQIFDMAEDEKEEQQKARAPIEMEIFPSLRVVEALNTKVTALRNVHFFAHQLRELHIEHTEVRALYLLLAPEAEKDENGALKAAGWRKLVKFQMNCCALATVDQSVNLLQAVRTLDLGWNQIEHFNTAMTTKSLEVLNLCHNQLLQVPPIQSLRSLKELDLAVNQLSSLKGIAALTALERLDVSHNQIADIAEVELLTRLPRLAFLKMEFNPIAQRPDYRREVLFFLGGQIELDGHEWSDAELNSMENRRKLRMIEHVKEPNVLWGQAADVPGYPKVRFFRHDIVVKNPKMVLGYPSLARSRFVPANYAEIENPPSKLPTKLRDRVPTVATSRVTGRSTFSDGKDSRDSEGGSLQGPHGGQILIQTVDDYFKTQRDVIITSERTCSKKQMNGDEDSNVSIVRKRVRTRSRKYTASDFMRDFEEEESLLREGNNVSNEMEMLVTRSSSQTHMTSLQSTGQRINIRVLLSAKEAAEYDLHFGIDGVPATIEIKARELIERFFVTDGKEPITISRWLPNVVAIGASIQSSRAKIVTMKLRPRGTLIMEDAAYQIDAIASLGALLSSLIARLYHRYKDRVVICTCANCGAISLLANKDRNRIGVDNMVHVYACLLCSSRNVREVSFKKLVAICASEEIIIPNSIPLAPPPWETLSEGFYIEEPVADAAFGMHENLMISCHGIREIAAPSEERLDESGTQEVHSDEWNDAVFQAMTAAG